MISNGILTGESVIDMPKPKANNSATFGFEAKLWFDADRPVPQLLSGCLQINNQTEESHD